MAIDNLTDQRIGELIDCAKIVQRPNVRSKIEGKHERRDIAVRSVDDEHEFILFTRQSILLSNGFTAGLRWKSKSGEEIILLRCNGSDHEHMNAIERQRFADTCHVHRATERYAVAGRRVETFAVVDSSYRTLGGALHRLVEIAHISGLDTQPDEHDLFSAP